VLATVVVVVVVAVVVIIVVVVIVVVVPWIAGSGFPTSILGSNSSGTF
jgi:hypothetical protein